MTTYEMYRQLSQRYNPSYYACPSTRYNKGKDIEQINFNDAKILIDGYAYTPNSIELDSDYESTRIRVDAFLDPFNRTASTIATCACRTPKNPTIENVIFNPPATIVFWSDKTKTIVKCDYEYEAYDPEKGIAMAIAKKLMGDNKGHYYEMFKHWLEKWDKQNEVVNDIPYSSLNDLAGRLSDAFIKYGCKQVDWMTAVPVTPKEDESNGEEKD